jgi:hypothetical protein
MNAEYVWWGVVVLLAGAGIVAYLAFGPVPELEDEPGDGSGDDPWPGGRGRRARPTDRPAERLQPGRRRPRARAAGHSAPVRTTVPGSDGSAPPSEIP